MSSLRQYHSASVLDSGNVLVVGGKSDTARLNSAELYDPVTETWVTKESMSSIRTLHSASLLGNGKVLVVGGFDDNSDVTSAELYQP